jgi:hypothetical protein
MVHTICGSMKRSPLTLVFFTLFLFAGCATPPSWSGGARSIVLLICKISPEQQKVAETNIRNYQTRKHQQTKSRYVAVDTLRPNKKQTETYLKKVATEKQKADWNKEKLSDRWVEPAKLFCVMVFDTVSKEFVGSGCYVVGVTLQPGELDTFETHSAEYIGSGNFE